MSNSEYRNTVEKIIKYQNTVRKNGLIKSRNVCACLPNYVSSVFFVSEPPTYPTQVVLEVFDIDIIIVVFPARGGGGGTPLHEG